MRGSWWLWSTEWRSSRDLAAPCCLSEWVLSKGGVRAPPGWTVEGSTHPRVFRTGAGALRKHLLPPPPPPHRLPPRNPLRLPLPLQGLLLVSAVAWLALCTWMFHGMLEVQLTVSGAEEALEAPTERDCSGLWLFHGWCERRVDALRAEAVREGMQHAWSGYKAFAWGADEIHPKSKTAKTDIMVRGQGRLQGLHRLLVQLCSHPAIYAGTQQAARTRCSRVTMALLPISQLLPQLMPPTLLAWAAGRRGHPGHGREHGGRAVHPEDHGAGGRVQGVSGGGGGASLLRVVKLAAAGVQRPG